MLYLWVHIAIRDKILAFPFNHASFPPILCAFSAYSSLYYLAVPSPLIKFSPSSDYEFQCHLVWGRWGESSCRSNLYKHKHLTHLQYIFSTILFSSKWNIIFSRNRSLQSSHESTGRKIVNTNISLDMLVNYKKKTIIFCEMQNYSLVFQKQVLGTERILDTAEVQFQAVFAK